MYDYDFKKETVIKEATNVNLKFIDRYFLASILLTDKNILIFFDSNKDNVLKGSGVQVMPEYVLLTKLPLKDLTYQTKDEQITIGDNLTIYNFDLNNFLKN